MPLLTLENLNVFFRKKENPLNIVSNINFNLYYGETFGLAGESGCGKSITALSIMGLLPQGAYASGKVMFTPSNIDHPLNLIELDESSLRSIRGKEIGMVFQEPMTSLNPVFTIGYQISEVLITHEGASKGEALKRVIELLNLVKIPSPETRIKDYPHQLSGGMRQRVMIAIAVACNPSLLIADEPTTALDVTIQAEILNLLHEIRQKREMSILFITHDLAILSENADRVAVMYAGRVVELAPVHIIFQEAAHPYTLGLLEALPAERNIQLKPIPGTVPVPGELPVGCKFSPRCRFKINECDFEEPLLREIRTNHFARCLRAEDVMREG